MPHLNKHEKDRINNTNRRAKRERILKHEADEAISHFTKHDPANTDDVQLDWTAFDNTIIAIEMHDNITVSHHNTATAAIAAAKILASS